MEKPSHRCRRDALCSRKRAARWLQFLKEHPDGSDSARMTAARQYRREMAEARKNDARALEYKE